jgi:zinc protease
VRPGVDPAEVERVIRREMARVASDGVTDAELAKGRRQIEAEVIFDRDSTDQIAGSLSEAIAVADWEWYADYPAAIGRVSADDVKRAAAATFLDDGLIVGLFQPKGQAA